LLCQGNLALAEPETERTPSGSQRRGDKGNAGETKTEPREERIRPGADLVARELDRS
jgi:hypothetical protein